MVFETQFRRKLMSMPSMARADAATGTMERTIVTVMMTSSVMMLTVSVMSIPIVGVTVMAFIRMNVCVVVTAMCIWMLVIV